jgi:arsenite-transporting ATPase
VIDDADDGDRCRGKRAVRAESMARLRDALPDMETWTVLDSSGEVTGLDALERVGTHLPVGS